MKIFKIIKSTNDRILLQADIDSFTFWCGKNSLTLNPLKCQTITFTKKRIVSVFDYCISQQKLCRVSTFKDLGVHFCSNLEFTHHINFIVNKASSMLGFIKRWAKEFNDPYVTLSLYNCHVRPHLEYASQVWTPYYEIHKKRIESIQHNFIRFALKGLPWDDPYDLPPYEHRILLLQMQSLHQRRVNNDLVFFHQLINGEIDAPYLLSCVHLNYRGGTHHLRTFDFIHIDFHRTNYGKNEALSRMSILYNLNCSSIDLNLNKVGLKSLFRTSAPLS